MALVTRDEIDLIEAHESFSGYYNGIAAQDLQPVPALSPELFALLRSDQHTFDSYPIGDGVMLTCDGMLVAELQRTDGVFHPSAFYFFPPHLAQPVLSRVNPPVPDALLPVAEKTYDAFFNAPSVLARRIPPLFIDERIIEGWRIFPALCEAHPYLLFEPVIHYNKD